MERNTYKSTNMMLLTVSEMHKLKSGKKSFKVANSKKIFWIYKKYNHIIDLMP